MFNPLDNHIREAHPQHICSDLHQNKTRHVHSGSWLQREIGVWATIFRAKTTLPPSPEITLSTKKGLNPSFSRSDLELWPLSCNTGTKRYRCWLKAKRCSSPTAWKLPTSSVLFQAAIPRLTEADKQLSPERWILPSGLGSTFKTHNWDPFFLCLSTGWVCWWTSLNLEYVFFHRNIFRASKGVAIYPASSQHMYIKGTDHGRRSEVSVTGS